MPVSYSSQPLHNHLTLLLYKPCSYGIGDGSTRLCEHQRKDDAWRSSTTAAREVYDLGYVSLATSGLSKSHGNRNGLSVAAGPICAMPFGDLESTELLMGWRTGCQMLPMSIQCYSPGRREYTMSVTISPNV